MKLVLGIDPDFDHIIMIVILKEQSIFELNKKNEKQKIKFFYENYIQSSSIDGQRSFIFSDFIDSNKRLLVMPVSGSCCNN